MYWGNPKSFVLSDEERSKEMKGDLQSIPTHSRTPNVGRAELGSAEHKKVLLQNNGLFSLGTMGPFGNWSKLHTENGIIQKKSIMSLKGNECTQMVPLVHQNIFPA